MQFGSTDLVLGARSSCGGHRDLVRIGACRAFAIAIPAALTAGCKYKRVDTGESISGAFGEGKRAFAVQLMADLQAECAELYLRMVGEALAALPVRLAPSFKERIE